MAGESAKPVLPRPESVELPVSSNAIAIQRDPRFIEPIIKEDAPLVLPSLGIAFALLLRRKPIQLRRATPLGSTRERQKVTP